VDGSGRLGSGETAVGSGESRKVLAVWQVWSGWGLTAYFFLESPERVFRMMEHLELGYERQTERARDESEGNVCSDGFHWVRFHLHGGQAHVHVQNEGGMVDWDANV